ncbi:capsule biosynthesis GfcC family protein [Photobacterium atrarenae]|uniref:Capsule biosynthesis GfcC family protein n=1 Tax=Photobacterium atrarenae TaxID=865757 RepID=A0ABY5GCN2_9GAMM|nr:capsule biosynthesis GfcC family protein [Photobacterium atrarenae]UTV26992.1 capsule biosynthesis GfcC family protein [Photobacterium atrarenae]
MSNLQMTSFNHTSPSLFRVVAKITCGAAMLMGSLSFFSLVPPASATQGTTQHLSTPQSGVQVSVATSITNQQQLQLRYAQPVRVSQILEDTRQNIHRITGKSETGPIYWPGASFYLNQTLPDKSRVISRLQALSQQWQGEQQATVLALIEQLESQVFPPRIFSAVDVDQVRITPSLNPLISENMLLVLPPRPTSVLVLGAVSSPQQLPWQERTGAREYLTQLKPLDNAESSNAVVIQPDGTIEHHPIAYWNHQHRDIAPGATLYLGFQSLPSGFESLNQDIINLLRHRAL